MGDKASSAGSNQALGLCYGWMEEEMNGEEREADLCKLLGHCGK